MTRLRPKTTGGNRAALRRAVHRASVAVTSALASIAAATNAKADIPGYEIQLIGLVSNDYTRNDGLKLSTERQINSLGQMAGVSQRYKQLPFSVGQSAWFYNPLTGQTVQIGLIDGEHSTFDGYRFSDVLDLNDSGFVAGWSSRYNRTPLYRGQSIWIYNPFTSTTTKAGLVDSEHTRPADGYKFSTFQEMNSVGQALGYSDRFSATGIDLGQSLWFYNPINSNSTRIGLTDAEHTAKDGTKNSTGTLINASGMVVGLSDQFNGTSSRKGESVWFYTAASNTTTKIGLFDSEYTSAAGFQINGFSQFDAAGNVVGSAIRYNGGSNSIGQSIWYYNPTSATTSKIGFTDPEHTRADGFKSSSYDYMDPNGNVVGYSSRFNGGSGSLGQSAWLYNRSLGTTIKIGLTDAAHTNSDGTKFSAVKTVNAAGQMIGFSTRYDHTPPPTLTLSGQSAWFYNPAIGATGTTVLIGLIDTEHTDPTTNLRYGAADWLNQSGQVVGRSERYQMAGTQSFYAGQSTWFFNPTTGSTIRIGLIDTEHTYVDPDPLDTGFNYRRSDVLALNDAGQAIGTAERYNGGTDYLGQSTWYYDPTSQTSFKIGLIDNEHADASGFKYSSTEFGDPNLKPINAAGQVVGFSSRYSQGSAYLGRSIWFYNPSNASTQKIGLFDSEHTRTDGYRYGTPAFFDDSGRVVGYANRFNQTANDLGQSAWFYSPTLATTTKIGLFGADPTAPYTRSDGYRYSSILKMNSAGEVYGYSQRYIGSTADGQSAWIFDPAVSTTTFAMVFSAATDGRANTVINSFGSDGLVLGDYEKFNGNTSLGMFAFSWSRADGFFDLGNKVIAGGLSASGTTGIWGTMQEGPDGSIYGANAARSDGGTMPWRLKPATVTWTGGPAPPDGTWQTSTDWNLGTPGANNPVVFNLPSTYAVGFTGSTSARAVNVTAGQVTWNLSGLSLNLADQLRVGDSVTTPTASLTINNGTIVAPGGAQVFARATLKASGTIQGNLTNSGGTFVVAAGQSAIAIGTLANTGSILLNDNALLRINGALINSGGTVDLIGGDMIVDYSGASPLAGLTAQVVSGYNNGAWNGPGIKSSAAAASTIPRTAVGIGEASTVLGNGGGTFDGQAVDGSAILVKYTYAGDANLDGKVDIRDLLRLASSFRSAGIWTSGDFDYNGIVDANDLNILTKNWQAGVTNPLGPVPSLDSSLAVLGISSDTSVPEPNFCVTASAMIMCVFSSRRRRRAL